MRVLGGILSPLLLLVCVLATLAALLLVTPGGNLTEAGDFGDAVARAVASDDGQEVLAGELTAALARASGLPESTLAQAVDPAVRAAAATSAFQRAVAAEAAATHGQVVAEDPSGEVTIGLGALRDALVVQLDAVQPGASSLVPPPDALGEVVLARGEAVRVVGRWGYAAGRPGVLPAVVILAIGAGVAGLLLAHRRSRASVSLGVGLLIVSAVPWLLSVVAQPVAEQVAGVAGRGALAGALAAELFAVEVRAPAVVACAGAALVVVGIASRLR